LDGGWDAPSRVRSVRNVRLVEGFRTQQTFELVTIQTKAGRGELTKDLVPDDVFSRSERLRKDDVVLSLVGDEVRDSPAAGRIARLGNLDPNITLTIRGGGCDVSDDGLQKGEQAGQGVRELCRKGGESTRTPT
jgi:hypothetical protein